jgi:hypothetical protein
MQFTTLDVGILLMLSCAVAAAIEIIKLTLRDCLTNWADSKAETRTLRLLQPLLGLAFVLPVYWESAGVYLAIALGVVCGHSSDTAYRLGIRALSRLLLGGNEDKRQ